METPDWVKNIEYTHVYNEQGQQIKTKNPLYAPTTRYGNSLFR